MIKAEKIEIIRWFIQMFCERSKVQTDKHMTNNLKQLEQMCYKSMIYQGCDACWYQCRANNKCQKCINGSEFSFPYTKWQKEWEKDMNENNDISLRNKLTEIKERLSKVSPEWEYDNMAYVFDKEHMGDGYMICEMRGWGYILNKCRKEFDSSNDGKKLADEKALQIQDANGNFIGHAPEDMKFLLDLVNKLLNK